MSKRHVFKVVFLSEGKVWEIFARSVGASHLMGFIEVQGLLFGERSAVIVDPTEERLRHEFEGVERTSIPIHAVLRIDEVTRRGSARITALPAGDKVVPMPAPILTPRKRDR